MSECPKFYHTFVTPTSPTRRVCLHFGRPILVTVAFIYLLAPQKCLLSQTLDRGSKRAAKGTHCAVVRTTSNCPVFISKIAAVVLDKVRRTSSTRLLILGLCTGRTSSFLTLIYSAFSNTAARKAFPLSGSMHQAGTMYHRLWRFCGVWRFQSWFKF